MFSFVGCKRCETVGYVCVDCNMFWWKSSRKEVIYNRLHTFSVATLLGITVVGGIFLAVNVQRARKAIAKRKKAFEEGELPAKLN